jgi:hypothetical protein
MKRKIFLGLLLVFITFNICAFDNVTPVAVGIYVDRFTDTAYVFTSTTVSFVQWPSGVVIWTVSSAPFVLHRVNWSHTYLAWTDENGITYPALTVTGHYFEFTTPANSPIHARFPGADSRGIGLQFRPVTRNGKEWIDLYWNRRLIDSLGCINPQFFKSYVRQ